MLSHDDVDGQQLLDQLSDELATLAVKVRQPRTADRLALGALLTRVRDGRLYRARHATFEAYVVDVAGISRAAAYRAIDLARREEGSPCAH